MSGRGHLKKACGALCAAQAVEKARRRRAFPTRVAPFAYSLRSPGGERRKETLLRKASETGVHAAGFGIRLGGLRPSEPPRGLLTALCGALCAAIVFWVCGAADAQVYLGGDAPREDWYRRPLFRLTAFAAGQSDCLLMQCGGESMMLDGGSAPYREKLRDAIAARGITRFKYLLNSHFHQDHISGLYWLMRYGFQADEYLHPYGDYAMNISQRQRETIQQAQRSGVPARQVFHGDELMLGEAVLTLYRYDEGIGTNGRSLVTRVQFGGASLLLTGDITGNTQNWMVKNLPGEALDADILKAPHHAITPMALPFLEAVSPEAALITSDYDRVDRGRVQLEARGISAFYSGEGTVVFETDGDDWYIYQTEGAF